MKMANNLWPLYLYPKRQKTTILTVSIASIFEIKISILGSSQKSDNSQPIWQPAFEGTPPPATNSTTSPTDSNASGKLFTILDDF